MTRSGELEVETLVFGQPLPYIRVLVGRVVEDDVDLKALGNLAVDDAQEL